MEEIQISDLKTDDTLSKLIPEMTEDEYLELKTSIENDGLHHAIDINKDNTVLDGRHRVKACKSNGIQRIKFNRHDLTHTEAIEFVRDTAIKRRHLSEAQRRDVVIDSEELVSDIQQRARESKEQGVIAGGKARHSAQNSIEPQAENTPIPKTNTNEELAKLADTSPTAIQRSKKLKRENPEAYKRVLEGESALSTEYSALPSVKKPEPKKEAAEDVEPEVEEKPKKPKSKKEPEDLREFINSQSDGFTDEERQMMKTEELAINFVNKCSDISNLIDEVKDQESFQRYVSTMEVSHVKTLNEKITKFIKNGEF